MQARRRFDVLAFARGALAAFLLSLVFASSATAAVGDLLGSFGPTPNGRGRGVAVPDGTTTAYYTTDGSEDVVYRVDTRSHASLPALDTNLEALGTGAYSFGALDFDSQGRLWAAEYAPSEGWVDRIDPTTGAVTPMFEALEQLGPELIGIDGLAVDTDDTLWISGEGLGATESTVYHVTQAGVELGSFAVPFGNSGIEVDAGGLWLAGIDNRTIYRYDREGNPTGVFFSVAPVEPEDLALDRCVLLGHMALWTYGADFGPLAAYDLGAADSSGCPAEQPPPESGGGQGGDSSSGGGASGGGGQGGSGGAGVGTGGGSAVAGQPTWLTVSDSRDPNGALFTYVWDFGDGRRGRGRARIAHRYLCAGTYRVRVTVIDTAGARRTLQGRVVVGFPRSAVKRYRGLSFSPSVRLPRRHAIAWLRWAGRSRVRPLAVQWQVDRLRTRRPVNPRGRVRARVARRRNHRLVAKVLFSDGRVRRLATCFYH